MMKPIALALTLGLLGGCVTPSAPKAPNQTLEERSAQIIAASEAVKVGKFDQAEKLLADYLYRDQNGELLFKSMNLSSEVQKEAIQAVALLLWKTGRDASLEKFANRYLSAQDKKVTMCRLAERNAVYEQAYNCWNDQGEVDRARRVSRTEAALRILKD